MSQLRSILGEAVVEEGKVRAPRSRPDDVPLDGSSVIRKWTIKSWINESLAYAPQQSYIRHATIRGNILFGQPFWEERYWEVLRQCGLLPDLKLLEDGEMTEVGEGGVTLVSLTRLTFANRCPNLSLMRLSSDGS